MIWHSTDQCIWRALVCQPPHVQAVMSNHSKAPGLSCERRLAVRCLMQGCNSGALAFGSQQGRDAGASVLLPPPPPPRMPASCAVAAIESRVAAICRNLHPTTRLLHSFQGSDASSLPPGMLAVSSEEALLFGGMGAGGPQGGGDSRASGAVTKLAFTGLARDGAWSQLAEPAGMQELHDSGVYVISDVQGGAMPLQACGSARAPVEMPAAAAYASGCAAWLVQQRARDAQMLASDPSTDALLPQGCCC